MIVMITISTVGVDIYNHYCSHTGSHTISLYQKTKCADNTAMESASCCEGHAAASSCCEMPSGASCDDNSVNDCLCSDRSEHIIIEQPLPQIAGFFEISKPALSYEIAKAIIDEEVKDKYRLYTKYQLPKIIPPIISRIIPTRFSTNSDDDATLSLS